MSYTNDDHSVSRRSFLKAVTVTAAAATVTGAGAAIVKNSKRPGALPSITSIPSSSAVTGTENAAVADVFAQLVATQAENVRLRASLDATQRHLQAEQSDNSEEALRVELETANAQLGVLGGLLALYEQLDEVDLGELLDDGLNSVSAGIAALMDELPDLADGVEAGRRALDELENHIPLLEAGRRWLDEHVDRLQRGFGAIERLLATAADAVGSFLQMLNEWFQDVLRWLPFGLGRRASEIMQAIADLLGETPNTISGLNHHLAEPMDTWLGRGGDDAPLRRDLVKPLREQVLAKADQTVTRAQTVQTLYHAHLAEPAKAAISQKEAIRTLIAGYRKQHQL